MSAKLIAHATLYFPDKHDKKSNIKVEVRYDGNTKGSLRHIARAVNFPIKDTWNTQEFGRQLIKAYGTDNIAHIQQFTITRSDSGSIDVTRSFEIDKDLLQELTLHTGTELWEEPLFRTKDNTAHAEIHYPANDDKQGGIKVYFKYETGQVKESLRRISDDIGFAFKDEWNTQEFGRQLIQAYGADNIVSIEPYTIKRFDNGSIETSRYFELTKDFVSGMADDSGLGYYDSELHELDTLNIREIITKLLHGQAWLSGAWDWWSTLSDSTRFVLLAQFDEVQADEDAATLSIHFHDHHIVFDVFDSRISHSDLDLDDKSEMMYYLKEFIIDLEKVTWLRDTEYNLSELYFLQNLQELYAEDLEMEGVPWEFEKLAQLPKLRLLSFYQNQIALDDRDTEILSRFIRLKELILESNGIEDGTDNIKKLFERLPECDITYD